MRYSIFILSFVLFSCNARVDLTLDEKGQGGSLKANYELLSSIKTLTQNLGMAPDESLNAFSQGNAKLNKELGLQSSQTSFIDDNPINGGTFSAQVNDWNLLFNANDNDLWKVSNSGAVTTITFSLRPETMIKLSNAPGLSDNPLVQILGPASAADLSKEEYNELLDYSLGENGVKEFKSSMLKVVVKTPRDIQKISGGKKIKAKQAEFIVPLSDIVQLQQNLILTLSY